MANFISKAIMVTAAYAYGLYTMVAWGWLFIRRGTFFKKRTEKEHLELQLARDRLWNLSNDFSGLSHHFVTLPSGFKFHFVSNHAPGSTGALSSDKPLVIFIHGFPDSWAVWRHIISSPDLQNDAAVVAIDLPGYGGTQTLSRYSTTNVLERLTELILTLRVQYGVDPGDKTNQKKVTIVAHDWGCLLTMRLAAEAPMLAHRFIISNGPLPALVMSNMRRLWLSARKMFHTALASPLHARAPLKQALHTLGPIFRQIASSSYVFTINLPLPMVRFFLTGGNHSFMTTVHKMGAGEGPFTPLEAADSMASSMGPSSAESKTQTAEGDTYPTTSTYDVDFGNILHSAHYYRVATGITHWRKSIETVTALHSIADGNVTRRTSSGAGLFDEAAPGVLNASTTIFWGQRDPALDPGMCLDGIRDFLVRDSQVVMLPESAHWTPTEPASRKAILAAVQWSVNGEKEDIEAVVQATYPSAKVTVRR
ncbi:hypothetical protein N7492_001090 [Penicillium capsulatum]|uniref:AB hydrolase-1 domain-containing protein n=1 Tax=Penicillium capsulatum TaxID=69766 RepID=A0A9W9M010_9EURO|nr:hypothetical protein N7492_001090 [Penicillium capsulatum]KAJ6129852.1 hypothetical protein N7512_002632 [Penicillium capsulatum]